MIGINKRYPAAKAKNEFRNRQRREQEKMATTKWSQILATKKLANALQWFEQEGWNAYNEDELWGKDRTHTNYQLMAEAIVNHIKETEEYFEEIPIGKLRKEKKDG
jgi:6-phosphogluconolactonase/glucosamine-6-phosphate isomerase/deaminase